MLVHPVGDWRKITWKMTSGGKGAEAVKTPQNRCKTIISFTPKVQLFSSSSLTGVLYTQVIEKTQLGLSHFRAQLYHSTVGRLEDGQRGLNNYDYDYNSIITDTLNSNQQKQCAPAAANELQLCKCLLSSPNHADCTPSERRKGTEKEKEHSQKGRQRDRR